MPGNGYYDPQARLYRSASTETWATYTQWDTFTSWAGTPGDSVTFNTGVFDAGSVDWWNYIVTIQASLPANITVNYGETLDSSGGSIDSPQSISVTPSQSSIAGAYGRYFQFDITVARDSASLDDPTISNILVDFNNQPLTVRKSDLDTSTLGGSVGARELTFDFSVGQITNLLIQPHITGLEDSAGESRTPMVLIDKSSTPAILNIFDIDTYGKRTRIDCTVDIQAQALAQLESTADGSTQEIRN